MSRLSLILIFIAFVAAGAHSDDSPEQVVRSYIKGYSEGLDTSELVRTFWLEKVVLYSAGQQPNQISATEWAGILEAYRGQTREEGWLRSEIVDLT